jgi:hypothetical protein
MAAVEAAVVVEDSMVVVVVADTSEAEAGCGEVERDPVSAVVARVITIAEAWVPVIRAGRS